MNRFLFLFLATALSLTACSKSETTSAPTPAAMPQPAAPVAAPAAAQAQAMNRGKVLQLLEGGGYSYAEVEAGNGQRVWVAGGPIKIKVGETVQWGEYAVMRNFNSKTLNRTFDEILFVNAWGPLGGVSVPVAPHGVAPAQNQARQPQAPAGAPGAVGASSGKIKSVTNAGGYSYLEVTQGDKSVWLAVTETAVKAGDRVSWSDGMVMRNFNAKSLGRTFDEIIFASGISIAK